MAFNPNLELRWLAPQGVARFYVAALLFLALGACAPASAPTPAPEAFRVLSEAYASRDAAAAASAYAEDGVVIYAYEGVPEERFEGRAAIEASFQRFFDQFPPSQSLSLSFRFGERSNEAARGVYELRVGDSQYYGSFDVTFEDGLFVRDVSSDATAAAFDALPPA